MMRPAAPIALMAAAVLVGGCPQNGNVAVSRTPPPPVSQVDKVSPEVVHSMPVNWDDRPGPDGLQVRVHFFRLDRDLPVTVSGTVEFVLYEGRLSTGDVRSARPFRSWAFPQEALPRQISRSRYGWCYAMQLGWGMHVPRSGVVTLIARYLPPDGPAVLSSPMLVAMKPQ